MYSPQVLRVEQARDRERRATERAELDHSSLARLAAYSATRDREDAEARLVAERDPVQRHALAAERRAEHEASVRMWADVTRKMDAVSRVVRQLTRQHRALASLAGSPRDWFSWSLEIATERVATWLGFLPTPAQTRRLRDQGTAAYVRLLPDHTPPTPAGDTSARRVTSLTAPHGPDLCGVPVAA